MINICLEKMNFSLKLHKGGCQGRVLTHAGTTRGTVQKYLDEFAERKNYETVLGVPVIRNWVTFPRQNMEIIALHKLKLRMHWIINTFLNRCSLSPIRFIYFLGVIHKSIFVTKVPQIKSFNLIFERSSSVWGLLMNGKCSAQCWT